MSRRSYGTGSLYQRTDSAGRTWWYGHWRVDGRQVKRRLGPRKGPGQPDGLTARQAEVALRERMAQITPGELARLTSATAARSAPTIAQLLEEYVADRGDNLKQATTVKDYRAVCANWLTPAFGDRPVDDLTSDDVRALRERMRTTRLRGRRGQETIGLSPKSIRTHLTLVSTLLGYAVDRGWCTTNVAAKVPRPGDRPDDAGRLRFLEPFEVFQLAGHALPGDFRDVDRALYLTAAMTGLRLGELRALRWHAVDQASSVLRVEVGYTRGTTSSPKSRRRRTVPMAPPVASALLELRDASCWDRDDDLVFAHPHTGAELPYTGLSERFAAARDAAGVRRVTFHELRHTFGTTMARAGQPVTAIKEWMGHSDLSVTERYMHFAPRHDQAARIAAAFAVADPRVATPGSDPTSPDRIQAHPSAPKGT